MQLEMYALLSGRKGEGRELSPSAASQSPSARHNPHAKAAYFGVAHSDPLPLLKPRCFCQLPSFRSDVFSNFCRVFFSRVWSRRWVVEFLALGGWEAGCQDPRSCSSPPPYPLLDLVPLSCFWISASPSLLITQCLSISVFKKF